MSGRARRWCFTLNNFTDDELSHIRGLEPSSQLRFLICGRERGQSGTPHLQGYIELKSPTRLNAVKSLLGSDRLHLEQARGTADDNVKYCSKDNDIIANIGESAREGGRRTGYTEFIQVLTSTRDLAASASEFPSEFVRYGAGASRFLAVTADPNPGFEFSDIRAAWLYGGTGVGKSTIANRIASYAFLVGVKCHWQRGSRWWCGYAEQPFVILDEFRSGDWDLGSLLSVINFIPLRLDVKHGFAYRKARYWLITTPASMDESFPDYETDKLDQLRRRIGFHEEVTLENRDRVFEDLEQFFAFDDCVDLNKDSDSE